MSAAVIPFKPTHARLVDMTIEQLLAELSKYAFVTLYNSDSDDTWSARANMRIKTKGAEFLVKSGYNHPNAKVALTALLDLVLAAVAELGEKTP